MFDGTVAIAKFFGHALGRKPSESARCYEARLIAVYWDCEKFEVGALKSSWCDAGVG